jgi:hypothetical protein
MKTLIRFLPFAVAAVLAVITAAPVVHAAAPTSAQFAAAFQLDSTTNGSKVQEFVMAGNMGAAEYFMGAAAAYAQAAQTAMNTPLNLLASQLTDMQYTNMATALLFPVNSDAYLNFLGRAQAFESAAQYVTALQQATGTVAKPNTAATR